MRFIIIFLKILVYIPNYILERHAKNTVKKITRDTFKDVSWTVYDEEEAPDCPVIPIRRIK